MKKIVWIVFLLFLTSSLLFTEEDTMKITSTAFEEGGMIPVKYSCKGSDISPPLEWSGAPEKTVSFVLICDDPDAPVGTWVHWVYFDIPATVNSLPEAFPPGENPSTGGTQGKNSWRRNDYGGPCPPGGIHRYFFKLYALDATLNLGPGANKAKVVKAMNGHILAEAQLMGTFKK